MAGQGLEKIPLRIPQQWDAKWFEVFVREVLANADVRNSLGNGVEITGQSNDVATISVSQDIQDLLQQTFVLATSSGFLNFERVLAGESGIVTVTDGGPNGSVTVGLQARGVPLTKLVQPSTVGVLGNKFLTASDVALISPSASGQAFTFNGTTLDWQDTPTWSGSHKWTDGLQLILGTGDDLTIEHDGSDATITNITGDLHVLGIADVEVASLTFTVTTNGVTQLQIDADGAWNVQGDPGTAGDVLTSAGPGAQPVWAASAGGGGGNVGPDDHPAVPDAMDDEFETGSLDAKWSWVNQLGASVAFAQGAMLVSGDISSTGTNTNLLVQVAPTAPWKMRAKFSNYLPASNSSSGIVVYNSGNSHLLAFGIADVSQVPDFYVQACTSPTSGATNPLLSASGLPFPADMTPECYWEIENDGTNLIFRFSLTGYEGTFAQAYAETLATHITAVTHVGFQVNSASTSVRGKVVADWFRRMS